MTTLNESNRRANQASGSVPRGEICEAGKRFASAEAGMCSRLERQHALRTTIVSEIIPRLMILNRVSPQTVHCGPTVATRIGSRDVSRLTELLLAGDDADVSAFVSNVMQTGVSQSTIFLDLFAPVARRLGELWESDTHTFAEVTFAMGSLQQSIRRMQSEGLEKVHALTPGRRVVLLAPGAGEQHWFAIQVLDHFFARAGWQTVSYPEFNQRLISKALAAQHIDVLGLSISRDALLERLSSDIDSLRAKSRNQSLRVLVGGRVFTGRPDLAKNVGADGSADDATAAVALAEQFVPQAPRIGV